MNRIQKLSERVKPLYPTADPAHDFSHVQRVIANCQAIHALDGGEWEIIVAAALLHDIVNLPKNHPNRKEASALSARAAREYLREDFSEEERERICSAILEHSFSLRRAPGSIEAAILQDADRLDALGAIGVMRTIATGAKMGSAFYKLEDPFAQSREPEEGNVVDHFYIKLLKLGEGMNTPTGRRLAHERVEYMRDFLKRLSTEIGLIAW